MTKNKLFFDQTLNEYMYHLNPKPLYVYAPELEEPFWCTGPRNDEYGERIIDCVGKERDPITQTITYTIYLQTKDYTGDEHAATLDDSPSNNTNLHSTNIPSNQLNIEPAMTFTLQDFMSRIYTKTLLEIHVRLGYSIGYLRPKVHKNGTDISYTLDIIDFDYHGLEDFLKTRYIVLIDLERQFIMIDF